MNKPLTFVPFYEETGAVLSETLAAWCPSAGISADAVTALRFALACPASAPASNVFFIRQTSRKTFSVFEALKRKAEEAGKQCLPSGVPVSQIDAAENYLSAADALSFPAIRVDAGARAQWSNPLVNVERIPKIARAFLWPERFTLADHGTASDVLLDAADALLGFELGDFTNGAAFLTALQAALPTPCEEMAANGSEYTSAPTDALN